MNRTTLLLAPALLLVTAGATASDLKLDGRVSVKKLMRSPMQVTVSGGANLPVTLFIDVSPGPVSAFGQTFPIGFTPAMAVVSIGNTDASGNLSVTLTLPSAPNIHQGRLFLMAVVVDPVQPFPASLDISNGADVTILDRNIDLAGNSLPRYPHFEHIAAINQGDTVELGIDPTRYPVVTGKTADVYIVASKTRTEWIADPTLVDAAGSPRSITFGGSTIQTNTFTIDTGALGGPDATPGSGDTRIGAPYDVVIDFDRDGVLGGIDLVDGYSDGEAGFYVVRDLTIGGTKQVATAGPLPVTETIYNLGGSFRGQDLYYPTNIATLGRLPLIVVSHGNGHNYQWYDHIGYHMASYGFIVMAHQNNTGPGSHTAAVTTLANTDALLTNQGVIAGGALNGHIDDSKIIWVGHSRGGDGVVRAYDRLFDGTYTPQNYDKSDIALVSSMCPVNFGGTTSSNPHDVSYHLWVGQSDTDVNGCPCGNNAMPYQIHDRATDYRQSISVYGAGHADFHDATTYTYASGPCLIGKANTHLIMRGYFLPLARVYTTGDVAAEDFLWRQYDVFRPIGAPTGPCISVNLMYQEGSDSGKWVLDNFQTNFDPALASSGASVTPTMTMLLEGNLRDADAVLQPAPGDPFNGFTYHNGLGDNSRGIVFSYDASESITFDAIPIRNFGDWEFLQFRSAQGTRQEFTIAELADLTFSVTLVDGAGNRSSIDIGAYGGGIEDPYQRNTNPLACMPCAVGRPGWNSDFETIRIRLADFLNNGNDLDLLDIRRVVFEFAGPSGSAQGYLGLDEIELARR